MSKVSMSIYNLLTRLELRYVVELTVSNGGGRHHFCLECLNAVPKDDWHKWEWHQDDCIIYNVGQVWAEFVENYDG